MVLSLDFQQVSLAEIRVWHHFSEAGWSRLETGEFWQVSLAEIRVWHHFSEAWMRGLGWKTGDRHDFLLDLAVSLAEIRVWHHFSEAYLNCMPRIRPVGVESA